MHRFSGVMMQTGFNSSESALSYELSYSEDGLEWFNYDQVSQAVVLKTLGWISQRVRTSLISS